MDNRKILLIEDNPDDVQLTLRAFKKANIHNEIIVKMDGQQALTYLFDGIDNSQMPFLILLDLKLPKMNGLEILQQIKGNSKTKLIPIIILTSSIEEQDLLKAYQLGVNSYIRKPVDFNDFIEAVQSLGFYWLLINQIPSRLGD